MSAQRPLHLGFLTVRPTSRGLRGGYLIVNRHARPVQFLHTTELPVSRASRALFGPEFARHVLVDGLARPLTERQSIAPSLILIDERGLLPLRESVPAPVILLRPRRGESRTPGDASTPADSTPISEPPVSAASREESPPSHENPLESGNAEPADEPLVIDEDAGAPRLWHRFGVEAEAHPDFAADLTAFERLLETMPGNFLWLEPFERVAAVLADLRDPTPVGRAA